MFKHIIIVVLFFFCCYHGFLLVNSQETQTNYRPTFIDVQSIVNFNPNNKWNFSLLGNASQNKYNYQPLTRQTNFGTIDEPIALQVYYEGQEKDKYQTLFGAFKTVFNSNENNIYKLHSLGLNVC